jgi:nucleoside phosphorylase
MEKRHESFDVCIVCALAEEVRGLLAILQPYCECAIEKRTGPRSSYCFARIKNDKGEPLNLHISWLPRYGPQEMTLHLSRVLEECQPRMAIMTGICAGDAQRVQLGDLVVAERTFTYDTGKLVLDDDGRRVHQHDTLTYQLDANILGFLGLFDAWKLLVARLKRPASPSGRRRRREIVCHLKPMASGSAVRADHPFQDVLAPVRGTVAIDMEGAAFGLVMSRHPLIPWLVVKGVCDYADGEKNDLYHGYAARASALYALSFVQKYVTSEIVPHVITATEKRTEAGRATADERARVERMMAADSQDEATFQAYLDSMSNLLLDQGLRTSAADAEVRKIARARSLAVLNRIDQDRKRNVIQFLYESGLITNDVGGSIVDLRDANLEGVDLSGMNLSKANLSGVSLYGACLYQTNLNEANLRMSNLWGANLEGADLMGAGLHEATLSGASLKDAHYKDEQVAESSFRKGVTLRDGSKPP